jgi:hypothetical protein
MATTVNYSNDVARKFYSATNLTADTTLTPADTGETFYLDAIGEAISLPAVGVSAGVEYDFICDTTAVTTNWTIVATTAAIYGSVEVAGAVVAASAETTITLVVAKFLPGDYITLKCDGTKWYVKGSVVTALGCTFA